MQRLPLLVALVVLTSLLAGCASLTKAKTLEDYRMLTGVPTAPELTATVQAHIEASTPPTIVR